MLRNITWVVILWIGSTLLLRAQPVPALSRCEARVAPFEERYLRAFLMGTLARRDSLRAAIEEARSIQSCFGTRYTDRWFSVITKELGALRALRAWGEAEQRIGFFLQRHPPFPPRTVSSILFSQARDYRSQGDYASAIAKYQASLSYLSADNHLYRYIRYRSLEDLHAHIGDADGAALYAAISDSLAHIYQPSDDTSAYDFRILTGHKIRERAAYLVRDLRLSALRDTNALHQAEAMLQQSLALVRGSAAYYGHNNYHPTSLTYGMLAMVYTYLGDTEEALAAGEKAVAFARRMPVVGYEVTYATAYYQLGLAQMAAGLFSEAKANLTRSYELAQGDKLLVEQRQALTQRGALAFAQGEWNEARLYFQQAITLIEAEREALGVTDWSPLAFHNWMAPYRSLVRSHLAAGDTRAAFIALEQTRARHLMDRRLQSRLLSTMSLPIRAEYDSLTVEIIALQSAISEETNSLERGDLHARRVQLIEERNQLVQLTTDVTPVSLHRLQKTLRNRGQVMLSFFLDEDDPTFRRDSYSTVFVVTPDTLVAVSLSATGASVRALMDAVSPVLLGQRNQVDAEATFFNPVHLHALYRELILPALPLLEAGTRLVILPDGPLFSLPFNMLLTAPLARMEYEKGAYLLYRHATSTDISAQLYTEELPQLRTPSADLVVVGKARFDDVTVDDALLGPLLRNVTLSGLPNVADEVGTLRHFGQVTHDLLDAQATESAFYDLAPSARIVHVSTHAFTHPHSPSHHAILLTPDDSTDGVLYLHELERIAFQPDLVVLSGCGTAKGRVLAGEGLASFQYAFRAMGAKRTLGTLWLVEDAAISTLMARFYEHLADDVPPDVALQRAQQAYLRETTAPGSPLYDPTTPFYWASPVFYGSVDPVSLRGRTGVPPWLWGLLLAPLAFLLFRRLSRRSL